MTQEEQLKEAKDEVAYHEIQSEVETFTYDRRNYHKKQARKFRGIVKTLGLQILYKGYGKN